jgi:hypothetical protein
MPRDPFRREDPTGVLDWLQSKGHNVRAPIDPTNVWNRPMRVCQLPSCGVLIEDRLPGALYCGRSHKNEHVLMKQRAAREATSKLQITNGEPVTDDELPVDQQTSVGLLISDDGEVGQEGSVQSDSTKVQIVQKNGAELPETVQQDNSVETQEMETEL